MLRYTRMLVTILLVGLLPACGGEAPPTGPGSGRVTAISVNTPTGRVQEREAVTLTAKITVDGRDRDAAPSEVRWSVRTPGGGEITTAGEFTPMRPGNVELRVVAVQDSSRLSFFTVSVDSAAIVSMQILPITGVVPGDTLRPQVIGRDKASRDRRPSVTLTSLNTVLAPGGPGSGAGAFVASVVGEGRVRATFQSLQAEVAIPVAIGSVARVARIGDQTLTAGTAARFAAPAVDRRGNITASQPTLSVATRAPGVVTAAVVQDSVRLTPVSLGSGRVVVSRGEFSDSFMVTVVPPALTGIEVALVGGQVDWARGGTIVVRGVQADGGRIGLAGVAQMTQIEGEAGLIGLQSIGADSARVSVLLPPFTKLFTGVRRDVGIVARARITYGPHQTVVDIPLNYRRPTALQWSLPTSSVVPIGSEVMTNPVLRDSTGQAIARADVYGQLNLTSGANGIVRVLAEDRALASFPGTANLFQRYQEHSGAAAFTLIGGVTVSGAIPPTPDIPLIGDGYIKVQPAKPLSPAMLAATTTAVARLNAVIGGTPLDPRPINLPPSPCGYDAPHINGTYGGILIQLVVDDLGGLSGPLAGAGWCALRDGTGQPLLGIVVFDSLRIPGMEQQGQLMDVMTHEILHALGMGTGLWTNRGLATFPGSSGTWGGVDLRYHGPKAVAAYNLLGGVGNIPVENTGGGGTAGAHWRYTHFRREVFAGYIDTPPLRMSRVTVGGLEDLSYVVDYARVEPYTLTLTSALANMTSGVQPTKLREIVIPGRYIIEVGGRVRPVNASGAAHVH